MTFKYYSFQKYLPGRCQISTRYYLDYNLIIRRKKEKYNKMNGLKLQRLTNLIYIF